MGNDVLVAIDGQGVMAVVLDFEICAIFTEIDVDVLSRLLHIKG